MFRLKYTATAAAAAAALVYCAIPDTALALGCRAQTLFQPLGFATTDAPWIASGTGGLDFRRGGGPRRRLSHKCTGDGGQTQIDPPSLESFVPQMGEAGLAWGFGTAFDDGAFSLGAELFAGDRLTFSGNFGTFRDNDAARLIGVNDDGLFLRGEMTAYATRNFALDVSVDYMESTLYGVSTNTRLGGEYLPFSGVPLSLYGGYDRTDFNMGGVYGLFSAGFTFYLGGEAKSDLRSYHRGQ